MSKESFLENENQMVIDAIYQEIGEQLVEDWVNSNLDEGQMYKCLMIIISRVDLINSITLPLKTSII